MKSFFVTCLLVLGVVVSAKEDYSFQKYLKSVPTNVMEKCLKESNLEADKNVLFTDGRKVDMGKLGCLVACTLKDAGLLTNGEIKVDALSEMLLKLLPNNEDNISQKLEIVKSCIPEAKDAKNDCEKCEKILKCKFAKLDQAGL